MSKANKVAILSHVEPGWNSDLVSADNEVTRRYDASVQGPRRDVVRYYALDILTLTYSDGRLAYVSINTGTRSTTSTRRHINNALRRHGIKARVAINPDTKRDAVRGHVLITPRQGAAPFRARIPHDCRPLNSATHCDTTPH
jgi:hypothetical protein